MKKAEAVVQTVTDDGSNGVPSLQDAIATHKSKTAHLRRTLSERRSAALTPVEVPRPSLVVRVKAVLEKHGCTCEECAELRRVLAGYGL